MEEAPSRYAGETVTYSKVSDKTIKESYARLGNIWKVAEEVGLCGQSVHERLKKLKVALDGNGRKLTGEDVSEIKKFYTDGFEVGDNKLNELCKKIGHNKQYICRAANDLGLTNRKRGLSPQSGDKVSGNLKKWRDVNGHPRGMLGKHHSLEGKKAMSVATKKMWADPTSKVNAEDYRQSASDRMSKLQQSGKMRNRYSKGRMGKYDINGKIIFFRSLWEANYALYLDFLIKNKEIKKWEFEVDTFWFEQIKRGVRSYKPDFKVYNNDGTIEYHEVKGWMDATSKTKLKRMDKYHPEIKMVLIDASYYKDLKNKVGRMVGFYE